MTKLDLSLRWKYAQWMNKKLDQTTAQAILVRVAAGERQKDLAAEFKVSPAAVSNLVAGKSWPSLPRSSTKVPRRGTTLAQADVVEILRRLLAGETPSKIAADYKVSRQAIANIQKGKAWTDIPRPEAQQRPARRRVWEA